MDRTSTAGTELDDAVARATVPMLGATPRRIVLDDRHAGVTGLCGDAVFAAEGPNTLDSLLALPLANLWALVFDPDNAMPLGTAAAVPPPLHGTHPR